MATERSGPADGSKPACDKTAAQEAFERGVLERGEAAPADAQGRLPPGVTHEIIGHDAEGRPILRRRRFSLT